jgi:hypothetical protein
MKIRLLDGSGIIDLKYLYEDVDRYKNVRVYFRRKGPPKVRMTAVIGSTEFLKQYQDVFSRKTQTSAEPKLERARAESDDFSLLTERTKYVRRRILEEIRRDQVSDNDLTEIGALNFNNMPPLAVRRLRDRKKGRPEAGNARLKTLRQVFKFAIEQQYWRQQSGARWSYRRTGSQGFHVWEESEVRQFELTHPIGARRDSP